MHEMHNVDKNLLLRFGPLAIDFVVTRRDVCHGFSENLVYTQPDVSKNVLNLTNWGSHAMLQVGIRTDGQSRRFLLQNWWRNHQFIEMEEKTLIKANANAHSICNPQRWFKEGHPLTACMYGEF